VLAAKFKAQGQKFVAAKEKIGSWQTISAERTEIITGKNGELSCLASWST